MLRKLTFVAIFAAAAACGGTEDIDTESSALTSENYCYSGSCVNISIASGMNATQNGARVRVFNAGSLKLDFRIDASTNFPSAIASKYETVDCHDNTMHTFGVASGMAAFNFDDDTIRIASGGNVVIEVEERPVEEQHVVALP